MGVRGDHYFHFLPQYFFLIVQTQSTLVKNQEPDVRKIRSFSYCSYTFQIIEAELLITICFEMRITLVSLMCRVKQYLSTFP